LGPHNILYDIGAAAGQTHGFTIPMILVLDLSVAIIRPVVVIPSVIVTSIVVRFILDLDPAPLIILCAAN
jgi:hypothetical protein